VVFSLILDRLETFVSLYSDDLHVAALLARVIGQGLGPSYFDHSQRRALVQDILERPPMEISHVHPWIRRQFISTVQKSAQLNLCSPDEMALYLIKNNSLEESRLPTFQDELRIVYLQQSARADGERYIENGRPPAARIN
jgi:hypothetical protein